MSVYGGRFGVSADGDSEHKSYHDVVYTCDLSIIDFVLERCLAFALSSLALAAIPSLVSCFNG